VSVRTWQGWVTVLDWRDGDSFHGWYDAGNRIYIGSATHPIMFRTSIINAPELSTGKPGADATAYARRLVPPGDYAATSTGLDEYARPLLDIHLPDGRLFSDAMLAAGQAVLYR
jgi:endonuclease YncB( thermonuclease family)